MTPTPTDRPDLLTVEQAAALLRCSQSSVRAYMRQGKIRAFRIAGKRQIRFRRAAVLALLEPIETTGERLLT